jgi:hypothetical protein
MLKKPASFSGSFGFFGLSCYLVERNKPDRPDKPDEPNKPDCLSNDCRGGFEAVGCWLGLDLALGHDGGRATSFAAFVYLVIDDLHALKIFLHNFFPSEFDVLFRLSACPLANSVDHVLFHENTDLFGQVGASREFRHPLADDGAFGHVSLPFAG